DYYCQSFDGGNSLIF
nr:immunoglobulin light chain junction region [Macaca mulatta]MOX14183.1 immunoglobulin light chain junction region [Macaca mulatta]MOX14288.1 immunoglobulin light chain junction region [Macaca mulatta]